MRNMDKKNSRYIIIAFSAFIFLMGDLYAQVDTTKLPAPLLNSDSAWRYNAPEYFTNMYALVCRKVSLTGNTKKDFDKWRNEELSHLHQALGLDKLKSQYAQYKIRVEKKEEADSGSFIVQKWIVWTEPTVPLPVIVLIPKNKTGKTPLIIATHGHGKNMDQYDGIYPNVFGKNSASKEISIARQAVNEGYIAIAPTMRAFGDTRTGEDKNAGNSFSCHTQLLRDLLVGRTPIGDRVWDMSKILDWAIQNFSVDTNRVAITGNSGGGTVSLYTAACDSRIKVAVPSSCFCTFTASIGLIPHCECNFIPGILEVGEMSDIAGLIAPRPLCIVNGKEDMFFPTKETRKAFNDLKTIYATAGAVNFVELYEGNGGHKYYPEGAWAFINKYFSNNK